MICLRDQHWVTLRTAWQPAFQSGSLEGYSELMDHSAAQLASWLQQVGQSGQAIDMAQELKRMTLQVVCGIVCTACLHCLH
jgi:cytochrome P450